MGLAQLHSRGPRAGRGETSQQALTTLLAPPWRPHSEDLQQGWRLGREDHLQQNQTHRLFPLGAAVLLPPRMRGSSTELRNTHNTAGKTGLGPKLGPAAAPRSSQHSCLTALNEESAQWEELALPENPSAGALLKEGKTPPSALTAWLHPFEFCRVCKENKTCIWALSFFPLSFIWADLGTEACT